MKAAFITETGPPKNIIYGEMPMPIIGPPQCLIKVTAVDVNPIDIYIRSGAIPAGLSFPYIIGRDLAGVVEQTGNQVRHFKRGDRVWVTGQGSEQRQGTFAEFAPVEEKWIHTTPPRGKDDDIGAKSVVGITAHLGLLRNLQLKGGAT